MANPNPNDDNAFDTISRLLASPMPRRQALKLVAGSVLAGLEPLRVLGDAPNSIMSALKFPVNNLSLQNKEMFRVINVLRHTYNIPVSLIQATHNPNLNIKVDKGTAKDILDEIVKQNPAYEWKIINSRLLIFPRDAKYKQIVSGLNINNVPRYEAGDQYGDFLAAHIAGFRDFGGVTIFGSETLPLYSDLVSLGPKRLLRKLFPMV